MDSWIFSPGVTTINGRSGCAALKQAAMKGQLADGAGVHRTKGRLPGECTISCHHGASFQSIHGLDWALIDLVLLVLTRGDNSPLENSFVKTWN